MKTKATSRTSAKMKNYYAVLSGKCYAFQGKTARDEAVNTQGYKPLTAAEAMKQFGYTDSCSQRVIKCTVVSPEGSMGKTKLNLPLPLPLYRGIAVEGKNAGKMIEGSVLFSIIAGDEDISIFPPEINTCGETIRPETLCMYIGKEDMNGKSIFTGYVLKYEFEADGEQFTENLLVYWDRDACAVKLFSNTSAQPSYYVDDLFIINEVEIIGNIYENPDLLKLFPHLQAVNHV